MTKAQLQEKNKELETKIETLENEIEKIKQDFFDWMKREYSGLCDEGQNKADSLINYIGFEVPKVKYIVEIPFTHIDDRLEVWDTTTDETITTDFKEVIT